MRKIFNILLIITEALVFIFIPYKVGTFVIAQNDPTYISGCYMEEWLIELITLLVFVMMLSLIVAGLYGLWCRNLIFIKWLKRNSKKLKNFYYGKN